MGSDFHFVGDILHGPYNIVENVDKDTFKPLNRNYRREKKSVFMSYNS